MIEHLVKGDYNFVLNYFMLTYNASLDQAAYNNLRKVIYDAEDL
jgi:hypothetical protein